MTERPVELAYEERGSGSPLVLVHGYPLNHTIWNPVVERLQDKARLILPDLRGFGGSPITDGVNSMRLMAEDLAVLLDRLQIEKAVIAGHSMGGYVALAFAKAFPERVSGLGLVASFAGADTPEKRHSRLTEVEEIRKQGVALVADDMASKLTIRPELSRKLREIILQTPAQALMGALTAMANRDDQTEFITTLSVPVLLLAGKKDAFIPPEKVIGLVPRLKKGWLVEIDEAGHTPMMEAPNETATALMELMKRSA